MAGITRRVAKSSVVANDGLGSAPGVAVGARIVAEAGAGVEVGGEVGVGVRGTGIGSGVGDEALREEGCPDGGVD